MKRLLAVSLALLLAMITLPASAEPYVSAFGGLNYDDVLDHPLVKDNAGYDLGAAVGFHTPVTGLSIEGEFSYRQNAIDVATKPNLSFNHDTWAVMANARYEYEIDGARPYVLAGLGYASTSIEGEQLPIIVDAAGFAWQVGGGVLVDVTDGVRVGAGYRYLQGPELTAYGFKASNGANQSVVMELQFDLK